MFSLELSKAGTALDAEIPACFAKDAGANALLEGNTRTSEANVTAVNFMVGEGRYGTLLCDNGWRIIDTGISNQQSAAVSQVAGWMDL
jgi:hypothetical protein